MKSVEEQLLYSADRLVARAAVEAFPHLRLTEARLAVLEAASALYAGWPVAGLWAVETAGHPNPKTDLGPWCTQILSAIDATEIPVPLALSALAREVLPGHERKATGAYYTDWRLATLVAEASVPLVPWNGRWIDPACGSGIMLVAAVLAAPQAERQHIISDKLCGADLSQNALRGALLAVASMAHTLDVVLSFRARLIHGDSLRNKKTWAQIAPRGFALVIGNPPWERLRTSRHEVAASAGTSRSYGENFAADVDLSASRSRILDYLETVVGGTKLQGTGEHDLYKLFLELALGLTAEDGIIAQLVPAGLIRAKGTLPLRKELFALATELQVFVLENRQRNFAIDSRFKFLALVGRVGDGDQETITLRVADRAGVLPATPVSVERVELARIRPDLSIPEVRSPEEWSLFARLSRTGVAVGEPSGPWRPSYHRELDMTNDRKSFTSGLREGAVPVLEGRHVSQFRYRAKRHVSGQGRAALWKVEPLSTATLAPQWSIHPSDLRKGASQRATVSRIGFCDITGQTNERSLLAARVPAGVVCGNKVPTLSFPSGGTDREDLFVALANSLVVDWMLRRLVTTTVNFFLLDSLPLPPLTEESAAGARLVELSRHLAAAEGAGEVDLPQVGAWRAELDAIVAVSWGLDEDELLLVLQDFPLLDRRQPPLPGETASTITADTLLGSFAQLRGGPQQSRSARVDHARSLGALPYVPAEYS